MQKSEWGGPNFRATGDRILATVERRAFELKRQRRDRLAVRISISITAALVIVAVLSLSSCASTYNACKDPNSYIEFLPEQCHGNFNRRLEWFE